MFEFIEVCAGAGGFSKGLMNEGFKPLLLNDNDKHCIETLKKNHPNCNIIKDSFVNIDYSPYKNVDLLVGGVPCQSFSEAGKRLGFDDNRGNLMLEFINLIKKLNPKVFVIENVKGLKTHNNGETLKYIIKQIEQIGSYKVQYKILNSNDYDVPQKRERIFIVGFRDKRKKYYFPEPQTYKPILNDILNDVPESIGYTYPQRKYEIMNLVPEGGCWIDLPQDIQQEYMGNALNSGGGKRGMAKRLSMSQPSLTLTTSPCQKQTERCHPKETRPLNIREYARIQTFPDDYEFIGTIGQQYKQIGNAVPVKLAEHIATSLKRLL